MDFETYRRRVGARIRKARWLAGLTQEDVAALGVSYRYYQEVERGERNVSLEMLFKLGRILGVAPTILVDVKSGVSPEERQAFDGAKPVGPTAGRKPGGR